MILTNCPLAFAAIGCWICIGLPAFLAEFGPQAVKPGMPLTGSLIWALLPLVPASARVPIGGAMPCTPRWYYARQRQRKATVAAKLAEEASVAVAAAIEASLSVPQQAHDLKPTAQRGLHSKLADGGLAHAPRISNGGHNHGVASVLAAAHHPVSRTSAASKIDAATSQVSRGCRDAIQRDNLREPPRSSVIKPGRQRTPRHQYADADLEA